MFVYAGPDDVENVFRPLTEAETVVVPGLIEQAYRRLRVLIPTIDAITEADQDKYDLARDAIINAVKRVLLNPDGVRQYSTTQGPYSESRTIDTSVSSGSLYIDPADLVGLRPVSAFRRIRSFRVGAGLS